MFLTHPHGGWCDRLGAGIGRDRAPSSRLRSTHLSDKSCSYSFSFARHLPRLLQNQRCQRPLRHRAMALEHRVMRVLHNQHKQPLIVLSPAKLIVACDDPPRAWHGDPPAAPRHMLPGSTIPTPSRCLR